MRELVGKQNLPLKSDSITFTSCQKATSSALENNTDQSLSTIAGMAFNNDFSRVPVRAKTPKTIQPKLTIGTVGDKYEQEADKIAEQVTAKPISTIVNDAPPLIQRFSEQSNGQIDAMPANVDNVLAGSGSPLESTLRQDMEQRIGYDFSHVRVHTDSRAAESAQAVNALAYTVGKDVVFGAGEFSPHSTNGKRLLAHELTHVVQQTTAKAPPILQRAPDDKKEPKRRDVVVVGEGWEGASELAKVVSGGALVIKVTSIAEVATEMGKIDFPVGTVYFIAHSTATGSLKFGSAEGFVEPTAIAGKLQGAIPADKTPQGVDFRGCSVGSSPSVMEQIRTALGAQSVVAGTCYAVINRSNPITIGGKEITKASQVTDTNLALYTELKQKTLNSFPEGERECILNKSNKGFFAAGGRFVSLFYNKTFTGSWIPDKSVCYKDLNPEVVDPNQALSATEGCKLIKIEQPPPAPQTRPYEGPTSVEPPQP